MRKTIPHNSTVLSGVAGARAFASLAILGAALSGGMLAAQTPVAAALAHKTAHPRKRSVAAKPQTSAPAVPIQTAVLPATPPVPELPAWPANEKPAEATITWDSHGLRIDADNSSLEQILDQVATVTGAKVEGLGADQRVFGSYGPGPAHEVLSLLLQGSGYNVLLIGDLGQGTPRRIVLSSPHGGSAQQAANPTPANDEEADPDDQPQNPPPPRATMPPGGRTPQMMQRQYPNRFPPGQQPPPPEN